jgi:hypothetical protein
MEFTVRGHAVSIGWLIALLVLIACFVIWVASVAVTTPLMLGLIAALAVAYLIG